MVHSQLGDEVGKAGVQDAASPASKASMVAANLLPLLGVLFFGWTAFSVVALYWAENVVIGAVNVLKMIACRPDDQANLLSGMVDPAQPDTPEQAQLDASVEQMQAVLGRSMHAAKLFLIPFFMVHFGLFCFVHGVFVFVLLGGDGGFGAGMSVRGALARLHAEGLTWAILALAASHLVSFFVDYIGRGEYRRTSFQTLMIRPYGRIVLLHVTLLLGGFVIALLNSPTLLLALFVVAKTIAEMKLLQHESRKEGDARSLLGLLMSRR